MITEYKSALYRISYQGVSMIENALGNPNLIQISVVLGCSIIVSPQQGGGIQYLPNGESRKWFLYGVNTKLNKTGHHFIYARLNRDGDQAYLIFSVNDYAIDGTINGENPSPAYYYVKVGEITETDALEGATKQRKITFDYGKYQTDETREGNFWQLRADSQGNEYIITKYPVLSQGAFTQYATLDPVVPSIFEGIPYDNQTIWFNPATQRVEVIGGAGGGEAGSVQWGNISGKPTWIGDTKPTYNWSEIQGEKPFYTKEEIASKYVTIDTEQEITALKHFTAGLSVGESKKKIYEENGVVYIDADVAVTGAMTFYASAGRSVSTIMDGVTVDEETITKGSDNVLRIKNAGAGSSFDENAMWSALSGSSDNQINKSHLTNALAGYATESWVTGKGYATESWVASKNYATTEALNSVSNKLNDFLEGSDADTIINKWKELEAFLSGMAETDNLAEILETKADKSYVDSTFVTLATKQTITGEKTFSSVLNTAAIKASGEITTPSLAASDYVTIAGIKLRKLEDGALMLEGNLALTGALTMYASNGQSFDTIYDGLPIDNDTIYWQEVDGSRVLKAREGSGSSFDKSAMWTALAGSTTEQINKSHLTTALTGYATESWVSEKNYAVKATTLAGYGITDGINAVSVTGTGNAVTAASISGHTLTLTKGSTFSLSGHKHAWDDITSGKPSTLSGYGITDAYTKTESDNKYPTKTGSGASGTWGINVTGNAGTATKLQTARSLWGNNFDGTANISGDITLAIGKGIYLSANDERWLLQTKRSDNTQINGIKTNGFQICTYFGDTKTMQFGSDKIYSYVDFRAEKDLYINGIRLHKTADGVITLEGNLAVTGGITTYAIDPVSASTVMDGVAVDGTTIAKVDGVLKVLNAGGGEAGSVAWGNITGKPSVFSTNIANITDLHSSWDVVLKAQKPNWLTAVSIATISDLHANWDALLKAAPSSYVTRWPSFAEVTSKPTTLAGYGITDAPTKTGSGASGTWGININGNASNADKLDNYHESSFFRARDTMNGSNIDTFALRENGTYSVGYGGYSGMLSVFKCGTGSVYSMEILSPYYETSHGLKFRYVVDGTRYTNWRSFAFEDGNVYSATKLQNKRYFWGQGFDGTTDVTGIIEAYNGIQLPYRKQIQTEYGTLLTSGYNSESGYNDFFQLTAVGANKAARSLVGGNTGKLVWEGHQFIMTIYDGGWYMSDNEWMRTYNHKGVVCNDLWIDSRVRFGGNAEFGGNNTPNGVVFYDRTRAQRGIFAWYNDHFYMAKFENNKESTGYVAIYEDYVGVGGNLLVSGGGTFYSSDIRYKSIMQQVELSLLSIANAPSFVYRWNRPNMNQNRLNIGGSAQYAQKILPWAVNDNDNFLSMDYATVAYTFAVHTARHLLTYETRTDKKIKKLEREIVILKKQLKKLGYEEVRTLDDQSV